MTTTHEIPKTPGSSAPPAPSLIHVYTCTAAQKTIASIGLQAKAGDEVNAAPGTARDEVLMALVGKGFLGPIVKAGPGVTGESGSLVRQEISRLNASHEKRLQAVIEERNAALAQVDDALRKAREAAAKIGEQAALVERSRSLVADAIAERDGARRTANNAFVERDTAIAEANANKASLEDAQAKLSAAEARIADLEKAVASRAVSSSDGDEAIALINEIRPIIDAATSGSRREIVAKIETIQKRLNGSLKKAS